MKLNGLHIAGVCLAAFIAFAAPAQAATETFDAPVATGTTQAPGVWYTDRYAPAGFSSPASQGGDNRLVQSISDADGAEDRSGSYNSAFYNTQGRKFDLAPTTSMSIDLFVAADWETSGRRMAGFWGEAFNAANAIVAYPILEFTSDGGVGRFRAWDSGAGSFVDMGLPSGFSYDSWNTLNIELAGADIIYSVGDLSTTVSALGATSINTVILQGHNTTAGVSYDIYWDNLSVPGAGAVPEPATWAMMIGGFGLVGGAMRRRRSTVRAVAA